MAKAKMQVSGDMAFGDEAEVPSTAGRKSTIPPALVAAVQSGEAKSYVLPDADAAEAFRALVRQASGLVGRRNGETWGAKTAVEETGDGKVKVYFQGIYKGPAE